VAEQTERNTDPAFRLSEQIGQNTDSVFRLNRPDKTQTLPFRVAEQTIRTLSDSAVRMSSSDQAKLVQP